MPIEPGVAVRGITEDEFYKIDHEIMAAVFAIHNEMGRFYDERIYQKELAYRCLQMGLGEVLTEVPIRVCYGEFQKFYYIDLLIDGRIIYELKTVDKIVGRHQRQALNYLLLMGMNRGKLINMRPQSVEYHFVSTRLTPEKRYEFAVDTDNWNDLDEDSAWLKDLVLNLLSEWGAFLETNLFYSAVTYFYGGEANVLKPIPITKDSRFLGDQGTHLLNPEVAFKISSVTKAVPFYERHLQSFLNHTPLKAIQWMNLNHDKIIFKTLMK